MEKMDKLLYNLSLIQLAVTKIPGLWAIMDYNMRYQIWSSQWEEYFNVNIKKGDRHHVEVFPDLDKIKPEWHRDWYHAMDRGVKISCQNESLDDREFSWIIEGIKIDEKHKGLMMIVHPKDADLHMNV